MTEAWMLDHPWMTFFIALAALYSIRVVGVALFAGRHHKE